ncbi:hypothetical protein [Deinococcus sp. UYEF24]
MTRRDQLWGWVLVLVGIARTIFAVGTALRHFVLLDLAAIGVGVFLVAYGIRFLTRKGVS